MSIRGTGKLWGGQWLTTRTRLTRANKHTQTESLIKNGIIQERDNKFTVNSDQLKAKLDEKIDQIKTDLGLEIKTPHGDNVTDKLNAIAHAIRFKETVEKLTANQKNQLGLMCRELSQWCNTLHELNESSKTDQSDQFFKEFQSHIDRNRVEFNGKAFANVSKREGDHNITGLGAWSKFFDDVDMVNIGQTTVTKSFRNPTLNTTELTTQRLKQYSDNIKNSHNKDTSITTLAPTLAPGDTLTIEDTTYTIKSISDQHGTFELMEHNATTTQTLRIQNDIILLEETKITSEDIHTMPHRNTSHRYLEMAKTINHQKRTLQFKKSLVSNDKNQETLTRLAKENAKDGLKELTTAFFKTAGDKIDTDKLDALQPREQQAIQRLVIDLLMELNDVTTKEEPSATEIAQLLNTGDPKLNKKIYDLLEQLDTQPSTSQDILKFQVGERFRFGSTWHTVVKVDHKTITTEWVSDDYINLKSDSFKENIKTIKPGDTISIEENGPQYTVTKIKKNIAGGTESFTISNKDNEEKTLYLDVIAADPNPNNTIFKFKKETKTFSSSQTFSVPRTPWSHILADRMQQRLDSQNVADRLASRSLGARLSPSKMINKPNHGKTPLEDKFIQNKRKNDYLMDVLRGPQNTNAHKIKQNLLRRQKQLQNHHNTLLTAANDSLFKKEFQQTKRVVQSTKHIKPEEKIIVNGVTYRKIKKEDISDWNCGNSITFKDHFDDNDNTAFFRSSNDPDIILSFNQQSNHMRTYEKTHPPALKTTGGIYYTGTPYPTYNKKNDVTLSKNQTHELLTVIEPNAPEPSLTQLLQTICPEIPPTDLITNQNIQRALGRMTALNHIKEKYSKGHSIQLTRNKFQWTCTIYDADGVNKHTLTLDDTTTGRINANQHPIETIFENTNTLSQLKEATTPDKIMESISRLTTESQIMDALQTPGPSNTSSNVLEHLLSDGTQTKALLSHVLKHCFEGTVTTLLCTKNSTGETPLHVAATNGQLAQTLKELNKLNPASLILVLSQQNNTGETPLHVAANKQDLAESLTSLSSLTETQKIQLLSQQNNAGDTPLHLFNQLGLDKGIDGKLLTLDALNIKNNKNETPLGKILNTSTDSLKDLQKKYKFEPKKFQDALKDIILDPELHKMPWKQLDPIICMASSSDSTSIEPTKFMTLLEQNDNNGNTLLHALAKTNHFKAIMTMVKKHCTDDQCTKVLSQQNNTGDTPLHLCTIPYSNIFHHQIMHFNITRLLTIQNVSGDSPLHGKAKLGELTQTLKDLKTLKMFNKLIDTNYLTCLTQQNKENQTPLQLAIDSAQTPEGVKDIIETCMDTINNPATLNELWNHQPNGTHTLLTTALEKVKKPPSDDSKKISASAAIMASLIKHQVTPTNPPELQTVIAKINDLDPEIKKAFETNQNLTALKTDISGKETPANNDCLAAIKTFEDWLGVEAALTVDDSLFQDRHELKDSVKKMIYDAMTSSSEHMKQETLKNIATFVTKTTSPNQIKNLLTTPLSGDKDTTLLNLIITDAKKQNAHAQIILAHGLANVIEHVNQEEKESINDAIKTPLSIGTAMALLNQRTISKLINMLTSDTLKPLAETTLKEIQTKILLNDQTFTDEHVKALMTLWKTSEQKETCALILKKIAEKQPKLLTAAQLNTLLKTWDSNKTLILEVLKTLASPPENKQPNDLKSIQPLLESTAIQTLIQSLTTLDESTKNRAIQCLEFIGATLLNNRPSLRPENLTTLHTILSALSIENIMGDDVLTDPIDEFLEANEFLEAHEDNAPPKKPFTDDDIPTESAHKAKPPPLRRTQSSPSLSSKETMIDEVLRLARLIKAKLTPPNNSADKTHDSTTSAGPTRPPSTASTSAGSSRPTSADSLFASQLAGLGVESPLPNPSAEVQAWGATEATPEPPTVAARQRPQSAPKDRTAQAPQRPQATAASQRPQSAPAGRPVPNPAAVQQDRAATPQQVVADQPGGEALAPQAKVEAAPTAWPAPAQPVEAAAATPAAAQAPVDAAVQQDRAATAGRPVPNPAAVQPGGGAQATQRPRSAPQVGAAPLQQGEAAPAQPGRAGKGRQAWGDPEATAAQDPQRPQAAAATQRPKSAPAQQGGPTQTPNAASANPADKAPSSPTATPLQDSLNAHTDDVLRTILDQLLDTPGKRHEILMGLPHEKIAKLQKENKIRSSYIDTMEKFKVLDKILKKYSWLKTNLHASIGSNTKLISTGKTFESRHLDSNTKKNITITEHRLTIIYNELHNTERDSVTVSLPEENGKSGSSITFKKKRTGNTWYPTHFKRLKLKPLPRSKRK